MNLQIYNSYVNECVELLCYLVQEFSCKVSKAILPILVFEEPYQIAL